MSFNVLPVRVAGYGRAAGAAPVLPNPEIASASDGRAGTCGALSIETLLAAYSKGLFPRRVAGCTEWCAPANRMVLFIENYHLGSRLAAKLTRPGYRVTFDRAFEEVVQACTVHRPRQGRREWLDNEVASAFVAAFEAGIAHSVEVWDADGDLVGGAYGLAAGKVFFTEAQFSSLPDAGKLAFATLNCHLQRAGYFANDAKYMTGALLRQGFTMVPRDAFNRFIEKASAIPAATGSWAGEEISVGGWRPKAHWLAGAA
ncbi:leucyl/phenylalanyl-tRNA--protein transferase [Methyloligella sp. 2.7D]|uniref:leucyl/phenylalanyl-tRNA--protein transferase n=1 Tax=unclassified Methyloligella TaxID=2625955 RepID=UPI00157BF6BE|nr:leucyl/phenylalanyl-tRNA--protein transferase [Methyloligella sp. GL2]QKP77320.1 leucyl/phenylalanyl-tRNA--protein transferase [Methyloligella sp. GL2]